MKTVKELIEFLQTQDPEMVVGSAYDGSGWALKVFVDNGFLMFSSQDYGRDHNFDVEVLFNSEAKFD